MPELRLGESDGLPVVWTEAPGAYSVTLTLRVGTADEDLRSHGITLLLLRLAAAGAPPARRSGLVVEDALTSITGTGDPDDVRAFLTAVLRQLADPPLHLLDEARRLALARPASPGYEG